MNAQGERIIAINNSSVAATNVKIFPYATCVIIAINLAAYYLASFNLQQAVLDYGLIPANLRVSSLLTSTFLHSGFWHLAGNMVLFYIVGSQVEKAMKPFQFFILYLGACFAASLFHIVIVHFALPSSYAEKPVVGSSGAVAGILGVFTVRFHRKVFRLGQVEIPALFAIVCWLVIQLGLGVIALYREDFFGFGLRQVGYWSHLGGFTFGIFAALFADMALVGEREFLIADAREKVKSGNVLDAIRNYEALIKYDPDNANAYAELGRLWAFWGDESQSLTYYTLAIESYLNQGREMDALMLSEERSKIWPDRIDDPSSEFRIGAYLVETQRYDDAINVFLKIAETYPSYPEAPMSLLKIGLIYLDNLDQPHKASEYFERLLANYSDSQWRDLAREMLAQAREKMIRR